MTTVTMPKIAIGKINFEKAFLFCSCLSCCKAMISAILQMKSFDCFNPKNPFTIDKILTKSIFVVIVNVVRL